MAERISRRKFLLLASVGTGTAVAGALGVRELFSSGNGKGKDEVVKNPTAEPTQKPPATETIAPTPTPSPESTPTPEPTKPPLKKLSEAEFAPTTFEAVLASVDNAFELHPDVGELHFMGGDTPLTRENFNRNLEGCKSGDQSNPYPVTGRISGCFNLTERLYYIYREKGYAEFYQASVNAANYFLTELPQWKTEFDERLKISIQDSSPLIDK